MLDIDRYTDIQYPNIAKLLISNTDISQYQMKRIYVKVESAQYGDFVLDLMLSVRNKLVCEQLATCR